MSDLTEWIKERRRIHRGGWSGTWTWSLGELDKATLTATGGHVDFDLIRDDEFRGPSEVLDEIVDAHNVATPAALTAIEKVLELHQRGKDGKCVECFHMYHGDWGAYRVEYPCATVRAIEGAIK